MTHSDSLEENDAVDIIANPSLLPMAFDKQQETQPCVIADGEYHQLLLQSLQEGDIIQNNVKSSTASILAFSEAEISNSIVQEGKDYEDENDPTRWYGYPLSIQDTNVQLMLYDDQSNTNYCEGLVWNVIIIPSEMLLTAPSALSRHRIRHGLNHRDFISTSISKTSTIKSEEETRATKGNQEEKVESAQIHSTTQQHQLQIKPRRPSLPLSVHDFLSSLTKIELTSNATEQNCTSTARRYMFYGILNGWYGLQIPMEVLSLEYRRSSSTNNVLPTPKELLSGQIVWIKSWTRRASDNRNDSSTNNNSNGIIEILPNRVYRAKIRGPKWTSCGWTKESPGFCFWYEPFNSEATTPKVTFGTNMITELSSYPNSVCTYIHMISHRYAVGSRMETPRDRLTYHSICLLEWDHGMYCTVVETAYLNGMGGYQCKCNWYDDKHKQPKNSLYEHFPKQLICPWIMTQSEIRCYDVPSRNLQEFCSFMAKYESKSPSSPSSSSSPSSNINRFIDVQCTFTHVARLTFRTKVHIAQYLLNYILRDTSYNDMNRNCQTFAADLCCLIAGKKSVLPFHPINRIEYTNRTYMFLYDGRLYENKKKGNKK